MKKIIKLTENDLTNIVKKIINENLTPQEKILKKIDNIGLVETIKFMGYDGFDKFLPDYFNNKENKIKLINELCEIEDGYIYLTNPLNISYRKVSDGEEMDDIIRVQENYVDVETNFYDEYGEMSDDPVDYYSIRLRELDGFILNKIFEDLVYNYIK